MGGIPHYMILDASGNIFRSNAPDPGSDEIKDLLLEASILSDTSGSSPSPVLGLLR